MRRDDIALASLNRRSVGFDGDSVSITAPKPSVRETIAYETLAMLVSGPECLTVGDLYELSDIVGRAWSSGADRDRSVQACTVEWSCLRAADHAVDSVYAPVFFLRHGEQLRGMENCGAAHPRSVP